MRNLYNKDRSRSRKRERRVDQLVEMVSQRALRVHETNKKKEGKLKRQ